MPGDYLEPLLITRAYGLKDYQVKGPDWIRSDRFDMAAKLPEGIPKDKLRRNEVIGLMLQKVLADLKLESRKAPIEILIVDRANRIPTEN